MLSMAEMVLQYGVDLDWAKLIPPSSDEPGRIDVIVIEQPEFSPVVT